MAAYMTELLIERIRRRATDPTTRIDMADVSLPEIASPLAVGEAELAESELGFGVPPLLKEILCTVGNGGFGPGYGLIGLVGGRKDDQGHDALQLYRLYAEADPDDAQWNWPRGLLPLCHWGCAIYSCVDCQSGDSRIVIFDPNMQTDNSWSPCFIRTKRSLDSWLAAWSTGTRLWDETYGGQDDGSAGVSGSATG